MATVYQETGIRNLDYGDRDSVGLFQQRPSQGWGTAEQLMDPYYATGKFYDALVKIDGWETGDINDVAQQVQRSGYPEAYRDHEERRPGAGQHPDRPLPRRLQLPGPDRDSRATRPGWPRSLRKTFGSWTSRSVGHARCRGRAPRRTRLAWAYAHHAVANAKYYGVTRSVVGDRQWQTQDINLPEWSPHRRPWPPSASRSPSADVAYAMRAPPVAEPTCT